MLADLGPGELSLDHALGTEVPGPVVALLALAGGIGGSAVLTRVGSSSEAVASAEADQAQSTPVPAPEPAGARPVAPEPAA